MGFDAEYLGSWESAPPVVRELLWDGTERLVYMADKRLRERPPEGAPHSMVAITQRLGRIAWIGTVEEFAALDSEWVQSVRYSAERAREYERLRMRVAASQRRRV